LLLYQYRAFGLQYAGCRSAGLGGMLLVTIIRTATHSAWRNGYRAALVNSKPAHVRLSTDISGCSPVPEPWIKCMEVRKTVIQQTRTASVSRSAAAFDPRHHAALRKLYNAGARYGKGDQRLLMGDIKTPSCFHQQLLIQCLRLPNKFVVTASSRTSTRYSTFFRGIIFFMV
jgi:hypothetical protein